MTIRDLRGSLTLKAVFLVGLAAPAAWFGTHHAHSSLGSWALVFDRPAVGKYEDISFPDSLNGWVVAARGEILHSADGGKTWEIQATNMPGLRSVDFLDKNRGFAGALTGKLYGTTNGGVTWTDISGTLPKQVPGFCGIAHVGEHAPHRRPVQRCGRRLFLLAGRRQDLALHRPAGSRPGIGRRGVCERQRRIHWRDEQVGCREHRPADSPQDHGRREELAGGVPSRRRARLRVKLWPINQKVLYASLQSQDGVYRALKTVDAGEHWDTLIVATGRPQGFGVQGIGFLDENTGWVGGFFRGMWATTDGGKSWNAVQQSDATVNRFEKVGSTMVTAGSRGVLRYDARRPEGP